MRILSGIQPSGVPHLGNYLGAVQQWVHHQTPDSLYCVVDLHAITKEIAPDSLRRQTIECAASLFACGLDQESSTLFVQSHVEFHPRLSWLLECVASVGELRRMTQFKEKGEKQELHRVGLFTYPVLMAADILLYGTTHVPVGDDQRQHLELAREIANRFNNTYGQTFVVPEPIYPSVGARVMDLQEPTRKMSKSVSSPLGKIEILDSPEEISRKIKKAVTDTDSVVDYDWEKKPGLSNLLDLLAAASGTEPQKLAENYTRYGDLKADTAEAVVAMLRPIQDRYAVLIDDPSQILSLLNEGAQRVRPVAQATYARASEAMGLLAQ